MAKLIWRVVASFLLAASYATVLAAAVPGQGTWETDLKARDIDRDGTVDAYYDVSTNLTWLADANANDPMTFGAATSWADGLVVGSYSDWRLPLMTPANGVSWELSPYVSMNGSTDNSFNNTSTELGHLFYQTLGNVGFCAVGSEPGQCTVAWSVICTPSESNPPCDISFHPASENTGPFRNLAFEPRTYWQQLAPGYGNGGDFNCGVLFGDGSSTIGGCGSDSGPWFAMAVRVGDVPAIPEPTSLSLALAGLAPLWLRRRQQRRGNAYGKARPHPA